MPGCGAHGVPADLRANHTLTFTDQEWRVLFIWAGNWASNHSAGDGALRKVVDGMTREAKRQDPTMPSLSLFEEVQEIANSTGRSAKFIASDSTSTIIEPCRKH